MREHCKKLRVVEKLSGAHLLFPAESSLAVRAYFPCDLQELSPTRKVDLHEWPSCDEDFDRLKAFINSFKLSVILFVLPSEQQRQQLDDIHSLFHRAQRLVHCSNLMSSDSAVSADV